MLIAQAFDYRDPTRWSFLEYADQTTIGLGGLVVLGISALALSSVPRRWILVVLAVVACLMPPGPRLVILGVDFQVLRILLAVVVLRLAPDLISGHMKLRGFDLAFLSLPVLAVLLAGVRGGRMMQAIGFGFDFAGAFLIARLLLLDPRTEVMSARWLWLSLVVPFVGMSIEKYSGRNLFSILGGVPEVTMIRHGDFRCQGAFSHPIIAGVYAAVVLIMSFFGSMGKRGLNLEPRQLLAISICFGVIWMANSSTPIMGLAAGLLCLLTFRIRGLMPVLLTGGIILALALHLVVPSGLHHLLFARFEVFAGSTGYHRYLLVDAAIKRVGEWWLVGVNSTYSWGWGLDDVTNEFVNAAIRGGLVGLVLFVYLFVRCTRGLVFETRTFGNARAWPSYVLWSAVMSIGVSFLAVNHFGQATFVFGVLMGWVGARLVSSEPSAQVMTTTPNRSRERQPGTVDAVGMGRS